MSYGIKAPKYAKLILDDPRGIYYSGQLVTGRIEYELSEPLDYSAISINYYGRANVHWTESEFEEVNGIRRYVNVTYSGNEEYFDITQCMYGGMGVVSLPPGQHKIPFQFRIPANAPSSYSGLRGKVSYVVLAFIDYPDPSRLRDQLVAQFKVVAPMDLNTIERLQQPVWIEFEEVYSCCCSSKPMKIAVNIPAGGFCPGQTIIVHVRANNESAEEIKAIIFKLVKKECFHSQEPRSEYVPPEEVLLTAKTKPILSNTRRDFNVKLVVPDMIAPNLENCTIIDVGFFFKVTVEVSGCNDNVEDETEIFIGLIPIKDLVKDYVHPMQSELPNGLIPTNDPETEAQGIQNSSASQNMTPYPPSDSGYPPANSGYPPANSGYPPANSGYPPANLTKAPEKQAQAIKNSTVSQSMSPYPPSNPGYPADPGCPANPGYTTSNSGYPPPNPGYPISDPGNPPPNPGYPTSDPGYPPPNPGYPSSDPGYPPPNSGYPTSDSGYPSANIGFSAPSPGFPSSSVGHSPSNVGKPVNPPYPVNNVPTLRTGNVGFVVPNPPSGIVPPYPATSGRVSPASGIVPPYPPASGRVSPPSGIVPPYPPASGRVSPPSGIVPPYPPTSGMASPPSGIVPPYPPSPGKEATSSGIVPPYPNSPLHAQSPHLGEQAYAPTAPPM